MKKIALTFIALLMAVLPAFAENVTLQTAQRAAQSFLNSKMEGNPEIHLIDFAEKSSFPNFYVFGNERCFVIIAADDCVHPVLGYSTEGSFCTDVIPDEVSGWLKGFDNEIASVKELRLEVLPEIKSEWESLLSGRSLMPKSRSSVAPLIRTRWNQKPPINDLCPVDSTGPGGHCVAGCGAIAIAQVMNYWEHPVRGIGSLSYTPNSHPEYGSQYANFGETVYDWDNMRNVYTVEYSDIEALAVATLVYHAAVSVRMTFTSNASYTNTSRFKNALTTYFDYSNDMELREKSDYTDAEWISMLKNDLDAQCPIIYRGCDILSDTTNGVQGYGHIFNCDGYDENNLFHFNWGHKGNYDGYYAIGALYPEHEWNYGNRAIFNCHPNTPSINPPSTVNTSADDQQVMITWSTVPEAVSYKLYRDDDFVSNVTGNSYLDSNVNFGLHSYTVKSVKADETMSLKSSSSIVDVQFPGPRPSNLQASVTGNNVSLSWQTESPKSAVLQYATVYDSIGGGGTDTVGTRTSWAQRFPASMLQEYAGMAIEKVDFYVRSDKFGEYVVGIYKGDEMNVTELVYQQSYNATYKGWHEIVFPTPVAIDYTQDLWIVFYSYVYKPTSMCYYSGSGHYDALLYSYTQSGVMYWQRLAYERAWMMKTYLTDGSYTLESATLQYGLGYCIGGGGFSNYNDNPDYYWAHRYPASTLQQYSGMAVKKVSFYFRTAGAYTLFVYNGNETQPTELLHQQSYTATAGSWQDIVLDMPVEIDYTQDLWIVFHSNVRRPASCCVYDDVTDARLYSYDGVTWRYNFSQNEARSWLIKTYLTDGTYTYNLYRNGNVVATNLTGNTYTDSNLPDGFYNYHVTTNYFGGESDPSNNVNVQIGTPSSQMSSFAGGWNWWSSYVELGGASGLQMLEEGLGANGSMIKSQTQFVQCNGGVWSGGLNGINNESSYKIQTLAACEVETNGSIASPLSHPITLNPGWNWIGYPCHTAMSVTTAFSGITPSDGDEVKSQGGFSQYLNGMWSGSLNTIIPGMGLLYHSNNGQVVTLVYPEIDRDAELGENVTAEDNHWFSDIHAYPNNMTVTAVVELDGEELKSEQYELAVFSGDECRGSVRLMRVGHADRYMAFLTVSGDEITELRFGLYDTESGEEYCNAETALTYETDVTVGNVGDPYVVRFRGATDKKEDTISQVLVFPNPVNDMLTIQGEGIIRVAVLNVIGQVVEDLESEDQKQICMNVHDYEQALYFLRIQTESGSVIKRFIKK